MNRTAQRIKKLLDERGWSEYRLVAESTLSSSTISNIFNRDTIPSIPTLEEICHALGITLAQFFTEDESFYPLTLEEQDLMKEWAQLTQQQKIAIFTIMRNFKTTK
ncbi:MAG: helix-turn-helix transcriptional regulator [Hespellia sp.]|nr:helix-turn-helix transcriptional regulator [Hespellia sp.]